MQDSTQPKNFPKVLSLHFLQLNKQCNRGKKKQQYTYLLFTLFQYYCYWVVHQWAFFLFQTWTIFLWRTMWSFPMFFSNSNIAFSHFWSLAWFSELFFFPFYFQEQYFPSTNCYQLLSMWHEGRRAGSFWTLTSSSVDLHWSRTHSTEMRVFLQRSRKRLFRNLRIRQLIIPTYILPHHNQQEKNKAQARMLLVLNPIILHLNPPPKREGINNSNNSKNNHSVLLCLAGAGQDVAINCKTHTSKQDQSLL